MQHRRKSEVKLCFRNKKKKIKFGVHLEDLGIDGSHGD